MAICMTAKYRVHPHFTKDCIKVVTQLIDHAKANEPGTRLYLAQQDILDPMAFQHTLIFEDEAALNLHRNSVAAKRFVSSLYPQTKEPLEFIEYNIIGLKSGNE